MSDALASPIRPAASPSIFGPSAPRSAVEHDPSAVALRLAPAQRRWMSGLGRVARGRLAIAVAAPLLGGVLLLLQAWLLADLLHRAVVEGVADADLIAPLAWVAGLVVVRAMLAGAGEFAGAAAAETIKATLRETLFHTLMTRPVDWVRRRPAGVVASAVIEQVEALDGYFARFLPAMVAAAFLPPAFAIVVVPVDWVIGLLFLVTAPLVPVFMALAGWGAEAASRRHIDTFARLSGLFADRLRGLTTLRLYGRAEAEIDVVRRTSDDLRRRTLSVLRIAFLSSAVLEFFAALSVAGVALYVGLSNLGLVDLRATPLTLATGLFCLLMAPEVFLPLRQLAAHYHDRAAARAAVAALDDLFDGLPEMPAEGPRTEGAERAEGAAAPLPPAPATLAVRDLVVTLEDGRHVLDGASFEALPGGLTVVLGASGAGKSCLLEAIRGLRETQSGTVAIDGRDLREMAPERLARRIAWLGQRPRLIHGTIADNIRLAWPDAPDAALLRAAEAARVLDFARALPAGLDTPVGERGEGLSGGEAQRVALARVFLAGDDAAGPGKAGLVLLDEPTAHLDRATEAAVIESLLAFARGRTVVVVTHSAAIARHADRLLRLAGGRLLPMLQPVATAPVPSSPADRQAVVPDTACRDGLRP